MKHLNKIVAAVIVSSGLAGTAYLVQAKDAGVNDAAAVTQAKISMEGAVEIALRQVAGTVAGTEFDNDGGQAVWRVEVIAADQQVYDLQVDAASGDVLSRTLDQVDDENDGDDDHREDRD